ncbi:MAG: hypothetical protein JNL92_04035 [Opitutaceae bacterium]|nr:hypothetical protein [Opitutaceae bacterium]
MSLSGTGVIAIWHNLQDTVRAEFYEWHNREHMPERLAVPGFRRGRRYRALEGGPDYFNLYETADVGVLSSPAYLARLNAPTDWTRRVVPGFRDVARSLCRVRASLSVGLGGVMLTQRFAVADTERERVAARLADDVLPALAARPGITGAHLCLAEEALSSVATVESVARGTPTLVPTWIVLIEGIDAAHVRPAGAGITAGLSGATLTVGLDTALYQLENVCVPADAPGP